MKKIAKIAASIALACGIMFCATGCYPNMESVEGKTGSGNYRFNIRHYENSRVDVVIDTETGVQYICYDGGSYNSGMTVLLDSDGSPLLVEGKYDNGWTE